MGEWSNTCYVQLSDKMRVAEAVSRIISLDGFVPTQVPPQRESGLFAKWPGEEAHEPVWEVAVFSGSPGWSFLATAPTELLCAARGGEPRPRLAELCMRLGVDAFQVNLYDGSGLTVLECARTGEFHVSGFMMESDDPMRFHGFKVQQLESGVYLLDLPSELCAAFEGYDSLGTIQEVANFLGGENAGFARTEDGVPGIPASEYPILRADPDSFEWPEITYPADTLMVAFTQTSGTS